VAEAEGFTAVAAGLAVGVACFAVVGFVADAGGLAAVVTAGFAVVVAGVVGAWALAATVLAANNRISAECFMALFNSGKFLTKVYQASLLQNSISIANQRQGTTSEAAEKVGVSGEIGKKHPSGAKALLCYESFTARLKSCPFKTMCFSAASEVVP
jgi:hypothetical protein